MTTKYYVKAADCAVRDWCEDVFYDEEPFGSLDDAKAWCFEQWRDFEHCNYSRIIIFECADNILKPVLYSLDWGVKWGDDVTWTGEEWEYSS